MPRTPPPPLSIGRPGPQPAHTAQRPPERRAGVLVPTSCSGSHQARWILCMAGRKVNYLTMALKHLEAARVSQLLCFSPTPSCVDVAPSSLQGQHAGGSWEEGWLLGSIACLQPHMVSRAQKKFRGRGREAGRPRRPDLGSKVGQVVPKLSSFFLFLGSLIKKLKRRPGAPLVWRCFSFCSASGIQRP